MSSDLDAALRWLKPQRHKVCPRRRSEEKLSWAEDEPLVGGPLMLDTLVYIDLLLGRTPADVDRLIQIRICDHSAVCLAELTHAFGRLDPANPDTEVTLREIRRTVNEPHCEQTQNYSIVIDELGGTSVHPIPYEDLAPAVIIELQ